MSDQMHRDQFYSSQLPPEGWQRVPEGSLQAALDMPFIEILKRFQEFSPLMQFRIRQRIHHTFFVDVDPNTMYQMPKDEKPPNLNIRRPNSRDILITPNYVIYLHFPLDITLRNFEEMSPLTQARLRLYYEYCIEPFSFQVNPQDVEDPFEPDTPQEYAEDRTLLFELVREFMAGGKQIDAVARRLNQLQQDSRDKVKLLQCLRTLEENAHRER
ncbi:uncharacterized protein F4822DRAFT_8160 [Hypoxylon trugodes]|uniref:uncharacterized protein n=1 Tax=Hypoxylon trugodes TaxID=326681 RepID=UPI0021916C7D|nr:uncharacterized protein F4822DRAFT_8160 [Hypoxylon trugodes]KAI1393311.1 hypothetical protein F4822DRAFT_8160 [Hypoxylon trugodes]